MKITLSKLVLKNFKGIRDLTVDFASLTEVFGDNATGKTTLSDAFSWLLFDKDSQNKKDFDIKTLDSNGHVLHGLEHEVEGTLLVDSKVLTLRKVYSEKWTKRRGSATQEFSGHTTDYFIDGVPVKQKEYKDRIDTLINEDVFKLLTNPSFFNEQIDWKNRRKTLLDIAGDVSDEEVINSNESLSRLATILNGRTIDDHRKVIAARRADINKELDKIPVRIDEAERSKPDTDGLNESEVNAAVEIIKNRISDKEAELARLQAGGEVALQEKRVREIEGELIQIKNRVQAGSLQAVTEQKIAVQTLDERKSDLNFRIQRIERQISENESTIQSRKDKAQQLRDRWSSVNAEEFVSHDSENCPTCGQSLPEEQVKAAHEKALSEFNRKKSERLEDITNQGKEAMTQAKRLEDDNTKLTSEKEELERQIHQVEEQRINAQNELETLRSSIQDVTQDPEYIAKQQELDSVKTKVNELRASTQAEVARVRTELADIREELSKKETQLAGFSLHRTLDTRIEELKQQERTLAEEYERLEEELYLTEEFIRTKVNLLESRINGKFKYARFKLFDQQINGGLAETCETLYKGVPYGTGLNNAARINVGLDIINTLSEHYGIRAPIFIDNAESVTRFIETNSQIIALYVSQADKKLRIETPDQVREAV